MTIVTIGIDPAKNVFAIHGVDATGKAVLVRPSVARAKLFELIASLPPCLIGMEACSGAHHWAREFARFVPVKTLEQQGQLAVHRARQGFVELGRPESACIHDRL